ncbi:MAG: polysaccharide biosynthesis protein [Bdellovibrionaceae bacterium]|nr:polysaccharide biosynthesis protein [Pseudobdellovibrionaceae bacterium]
MKFAKLSRRWKISIVLASDLILLPMALWSAIALRIGTLTPPVEVYWWVFFALPIMTVPIFIRLGLYRAVVRYMDDRIIYTVILGVGLSALFLATVLMMMRESSFPRSAVLIYAVIAVAYITSSRFIARGLIRSFEDGRSDRRERVAIFGAGRAGLQTALALSSGAEFRPIAFFDDDANLQGTSVAGVRVYDPKEAIEIMAKKDCHQLLLAIPSASRARRRQIIMQFEGKGIELKTLPGMGDLVHGTVRIEDIRPVGVEDLLGRDSVSPEEDLLGPCLTGKRIMVTGAGGSIGSELCRQIVKMAPESLVMLEISEFNLYEISQEISSMGSGVRLIPVLGDCRNQTRMASLMKEHRIQTLYHAAAYKHVPLVEANVVEGVENNVFGTMATALAAVEAGVARFVLISTDKAVRPTNVMGATKRLAELVLQGLAAQPESHATCFSMVRFGNVLGSSGSVVPLFREQIRRGGPVTVTHPEVTRYFMTIPEAAQLVLQAGTMSTGGDVFVLDMGESIRIVELAQKMIQLSGLTLKNAFNPEGDIEIAFVGLRPGEKLYEELLIGDNVEKTKHPRIMRAVERSIPWPELSNGLIELKKMAGSSKEHEMKDFLKKFVIEYRPSLSVE